MAARSVLDNAADSRIKYENFLVMLITTGSLVAFSNDGIGFLTGMVAAAIVAAQRLGPRCWYERCVKRMTSLKPRSRQEEVDTLPSSINLEEQSTDETPIVPRGAKD
jgi:hypothetical protein